MIPKTTKNNPYIEFRFDKKGRMKLKATTAWWGGINSGFISSDGSEGNTCEPKNLKKYIKRFKEKKIKKLEKEILKLQKQLNFIKENYNTI